MALLFTLIKEVYLMFSDRIARLRKDKGLNQKDFAEELGVSVDSVRRWEQGKRSPDIDILGKIAQVLNTTVSYISGETDNPERQNNGNEKLFLSLQEGIDNQLSFIRKGDFIGNGQVLFYHGNNGTQFVIPATDENQSWFREVMSKAIANDLMAAK